MLDISNHLSPRGMKQVPLASKVGSPKTGLTPRTRSLQRVRRQKPPHTTLTAMYMGYAQRVKVLVREIRSEIDKTAASIYQMNVLIREQFRAMARFTSWEAFRQGPGGINPDRPASRLETRLFQMFDNVLDEAGDETEGISSEKRDHLATETVVFV